MKETTIAKYADNIASSADLLGSAKPSVLFYPLASLLRGLICGKGERMLSGVSIALRQLIHPIIMLLVPAFMDYKQVFESKNALLGIDAPDKPLELSKEPMIWCVNHGFKDDVAASIHATRHSYVYFGSLPHFYNTFDGLALFFNGAILCNRKIRRLPHGKTDQQSKIFDLEIELCADYQPKDIIRSENVLQSVADIQNVYAGNASHVQYARTLVAREKCQDFQRRF